jgi:hypothetical protein
VLAWHSESECDIVAALEFQNLARLVGGRDVQAKSFDDLSNLRHLEAAIAAIGICARPAPRTDQ